MVMEIVAVVVVLACCLVVFLLRPADDSRRQDLEASLEAVDDNGLFSGWDELSPSERTRRLSMYQRRVLVRHAEQEREWLRARLRDITKG